jgi:hypothetical protein
MTPAREITWSRTAAAKRPWPNTKKATKGREHEDGAQLEHARERFGVGGACEVRREGHERAWG